MISFNVERFNESTNDDFVQFTAQLIIENIDMSMYMYDRYSNTVFNESYITEGALGDFFNKIIGFIKEIVSKFLNWVRSVKNNIMSGSRKSSSGGSSTTNNTKTELTPEQREEKAKEKFKILSFNNKHMGDIGDLIEDFQKGFARMSRPVTDLLKDEYPEEMLNDIDGQLKQAIEYYTNEPGFDITNMNSYLQENETTLEEFNKKLTEQGDPLNLYKSAMSKIDSIRADFEKAAKICEKSIENDRKDIDRIAGSFDKTIVQKMITAKVKFLSEYSKLYTKVISAIHGATTKAVNSIESALSRHKQLYG